MDAPPPPRPRPAPLLARPTATSPGAFAGASPPALAALAVQAPTCRGTRRRSPPRGPRGGPRRPYHAQSFLLCRSVRASGSVGPVARAVLLHDGLAGLRRGGPAAAAGAAAARLL